MKCFSAKGTFAVHKKFKWLNVAESKVIPDVWIDVISQPDRGGVFHGADRKVLPAALKTAHTHCSDTHFVPHQYGASARRRPRMSSPQHSAKQITDGREQRKQTGTNKWLCRYPPVSPPCIPMSLLHLCVLPLIYRADFANSGGPSASQGTLPSLQSGPVKHPTGAGSNLLRRPAEQLCLNGVALYYPT